MLTAITIAVMAKKRGRNLWSWGIIGAIAFLIIDSVVASLLALVLWNTISDASLIIFIAVKFLLFSAFVAVIQVMLIHSTAQRKKVEPEGTGKTPIQTQVLEIKAVINPAPEIICSNCGNAGWPKDKYCRKCGSPLQ